MCDVVVKKEEYGRVFAVINDYDEKGKKIICGNKDEAKRMQAQIIQYRALMSLGITDEQIANQVKKIEADNKVRIVSLAMYQID